MRDETKTTTHIAYMAPHCLNLLSLLVASNLKTILQLHVGLKGNFIYDKSMFPKIKTFSENHVVA